VYWDIFQGFTYNALIWTPCGFTVAACRIQRQSQAAALAPAGERAVAA